MDTPAHANNFDLLRLVFAGSVMLRHLPTLSGAPQLEALAWVFPADIAVKAFFVISGYLVMMSWERSASLADYAGKRARRIYPAYAAVVIVCGLGGALLTRYPVAAYFDGDLARYLAANLVFLNFLAPDLPGVFESQPFVEVNGALWTLKIEVLYYACVPLLAWLLMGRRRWWVLAALYALSVAYVLATGDMYARTGAGIWLQLQRQLPGQLGYFLAGTGLYFLRERIQARSAAIAIVAAAALVSVRLAATPLLTIALEPLALGVVVIFAATGLPHLGNFARFGDFSYGVYIIHFPVIQTLVATGLFERSLWAGAALSIVLVVVLSALSWHAVERPFLRRRSHYRLVERRGTVA